MTEESFHELLAAIERKHALLSDEDQGHFLIQVMVRTSVEKIKAAKSYGATEIDAEVNLPADFEEMKNDLQSELEEFPDHKATLIRALKIILLENGETPESTVTTNPGILPD
jgi:hypothetical protein